ncbi:MAG: AMP-binding protein [Spirochaetes bacterium]|nr:AMP-binding protein [Spirochaetota bacterium]
MKLQYQYRLDKTLITLFIESALKNKNKEIYRYKKNGSEFTGITYGDFYKKVKLFAGGIYSMGLAEKKMAIISDNCIEWMAAVLSNMGLKGVDVPRGNNTSSKELEYILKISDIDYICLQNKDSLEKLNQCSYLKKIPRIFFNSKKIELQESDFTFDEICQKGEDIILREPDFFENLASQVKPGDLATIIFTSGTTGIPKGVMLTHKNLTYAPTEVPGLITAYEDDRWMSILPVWHVGERFFEFMGIIHGITIVLSSVYALRDDMKKERPHLIPGVPLVWKKVMTGIKSKMKQSGKNKMFDFFSQKSLGFITAKRSLKKTVASFKKKSFFTLFQSILRLFIYFPFHKLADTLIYQKIRAATGGNIRTITSGGGNLPNDVDDFFEIIGIDLVDGYGATETAVMVSIRGPKNVRHSIGRMMPRTEYTIVHPETQENCQQGESGILKVKGDQVFKGYYKNETDTQKVLTEDGWYDTGDLVRETLSGDLVFVGRAKDTIVMLNGENVEPEPLEEAMEDSEIIKHALVYGQDQEALSALIVPNLDALKVILGNDWKSEYSELLKSKDIYQLFKKEIKSRINLEKGFKINELIHDFVLLEDDFTIGEELTNTMKKRRGVIFSKYNQLLKLD